MNGHALLDRLIIYITVCTRMRLKYSIKSDIWKSVGEQNSKVSYFSPTFTRIVSTQS